MRTVALVIVLLAGCAAPAMPTQTTVDAPAPGHDALDFLTVATQKAHAWNANAVLGGIVALDGKPGPCSYGSPASDGGPQGDGRQQAWSFIFILPESIPSLPPLGVDGPRPAAHVMQVNASGVVKETDIPSSRSKADYCAGGWPRDAAPTPKLGSIEAASIAATAAPRFAQMRANGATVGTIYAFGPKGRFYDTYGCGPVWHLWVDASGDNISGGKDFWYVVVDANSGTVTYSGSYDTDGPTCSGDGG